MKRRIRATPSRKSSRKNTGQGLIEGVVGTWLVITAGVAIILLLLNLGLAVTNQEKLNVVATAAASHICQGHYFLGMEILDASGNVDQAKQNARIAEAQVLTTTMLTSLGLPDFNRDSFAVDLQTVPLGNANGGEANIVTVTFNVGGLSTIGSFFAPFALNATGISSESAIPPPATCTLHFHDLPSANPTGMLRNIRVPVYFAGIANQTTNYPLTPKGRFVGDPPHTYISPYADLYRGDVSHPSIGYESQDSRSDAPLPFWGLGTNGQGNPAGGLPTP